MCIASHRQRLPLCGRLAPILLVLGCGNQGGSTDPTPGTGTESAGSASASESADETTPASATETMGPTTTASDTEPGDTEPGDTEPGDTEPGGGSVDPVLLYEGNASTGVVPDWDPDDPRPVLTYRYVEFESTPDQWSQGMVPVQADGTLAYDAELRVNVWGWEQPPPLLYEGSLADGAIPDWSFEDPTPVVSLMWVEADDTWHTAMFVIYADGSLESFTQESPRLLLWGWPTGTPGAPSVRYQGLVGGSEVPGWDPMNFRPVLMMTRDPGGDEWGSFLVRINDQGEIIDNIPNEALVWGW